MMNTSHLVRWIDLAGGVLTWMNDSEEDGNDEDCKTCDCGRACKQSHDRHNFAAIGVTWWKVRGGFDLGCTDVHRVFHMGSTWHNALRIAVHVYSNSDLQATAGTVHPASAGLTSSHHPVTSYLNWRASAELSDRKIHEVSSHLHVLLHVPWRSIPNPYCAAAGTL